MISISVIVPNYNHASFLKQRIESILQQTYENFELIILDDCSTDNSREIIESYLGHHKISQIIFNEKNSGSPFGLWQKGIDLATGDWIWIAESDDMAEPGFLEEALQAIEQFPSLDTFYCDCFIIDENGKALAEKFSDRKNRVFNTSKWSSSYFSIGINEINECLKFDCTINNMSSIVFRKTLATAKAEHVDEFHFHGDWFFLLKTVLAGNLYYSNKPLNHYRIYEKSHSSGLTLVQSCYECFRILVLLYYNENVKDKKQLLDYFTFNCLMFGLIEHGPKRSWKIFQSYLKTDRTLALKVIAKIANIKLFRKKQTVFVKDTI